MNYSTLLTVVFLGMFFFINAQNAADQIFMTNGETIAGKVKKVAPNTITYSYVGEGLENVVKKDSVNKPSLKVDGNIFLHKPVLMVHLEIPIMNIRLVK